MQTFLQTQQQTLKAPKRKQFFGKDWLLVPVLTLYFFLFPWLAFSCSSQIRERGPVKNTWLVCNFIDSLSRLGHPRPLRLHSQHFPRIPTQAFATYCALTRLRTPDLKSPLCPYEIPLWADYSRGTPQNPNSSRSGKQIHKQDWKRLYPDNKIKKTKNDTNCQNNNTKSRKHKENRWENVHKAISFRWYNLSVTSPFAHVALQTQRKIHQLIKTIQT